MQAPSSSELDALDFTQKRPILKHLNADSSWLLSLPYPNHVQPPTGRQRFNIVIDVWLRGPQIDLFRCFSSQEHASISNVQNFVQLNQLLQDAESTADDGLKVDQDEYFIDAVLCSHEFTDHCHEATLKELPQNVPVFAPKKAAALVRSWKHFETVTDIPICASLVDSNIRALPEWITVSRVHTDGDGPIYFHSALLITFSLDQDKTSESIVYTPHGVAADSLEAALAIRNHTNVLALLHGLHDVSLVGNQLNMGFENAIKIVNSLEVKYWIPTHDEVKVASGIVSPFLKRIEHTFPLAPGSHPITEPDRAKPRVSKDSFVELGNGETCVLK